MIPKNEWKWHGHAGHLIVGRDCRYHLLTEIGPWQVSTVGEYLPDEGIREILAKSRGITLEGQGDARLHDYMNKIGYETIGCDRLYETMVFRIAEGFDGRAECGCPRVLDFSELDFNGYNDPKAATEGHYTMCEKWAAITLEEWVTNNKDDQT